MLRRSHFTSRINRSVHSKPPSWLRAPLGPAHKHNYGKCESFERRLKNHCDVQHGGKMDERCRACEELAAKVKDPVLREMLRWRFTPFAAKELF